ncbi:hypothetical protein Q4Q35_03735 [Flavivirga aquimarina]|uniref:O-antigen ligase domain-containing protein n=1 Tax=Flavivirga aquimarina TaxID=2027862 RepID=A0ABT8W715_9FLAO|nr:hypothetical protein [Flavivirga aquimarina]MDO5968908.1 hypothetical protein [Flavivirga aquimarina]
MIVFLVLILIVIIFVRLFKGMFAAFLVLVATKSFMDAFWDIRVGPLSFSSVGGILIPILFYPVFLKMRCLPGKWISNAKLLFIAYSFGVLFAFPIKPMESLEILLININILMGFLLIPLLVDSRDKLRKLLIAIMVSGMFPIAISIFQFQTGILFSERQTAGLTRYVGLYHDAFPVRFYGMFTLFSCLMYLSIFKIKNKLSIVVLIALCCAALFSVYLVFSKAAVTIIVLWTLLMLAFSQIKLKYVFFFSICFILVSVNLGDVIYDNIQQLFSKEVGYNDGTYTDVRYTLAGRGYIWDDLWSFWINEQIPLFQWTGDGINRPTHNEFLRVLLANGIIGLILFSFFIFRSIKYVFEINKKVRVFGLMLLGMFFIDSLGLTPGVYYYYSILVWGIIGLLLLKPDLLKNI